MRLRAFVIVGSLSALTAAAAPLHAQSLADVARKEEERRKEIRQPSKVITNKDLGAVPAPPAGQPTIAPPAADAAKQAQKDTEADKAAEPKEPVKDQAYWAGRLKGLQTQLDRDQTYAEALQSRINALTTDFVNRDDPAQRAVLERDRQKAVAELNRLKEAVQADNKAIADLQEEARRAGVPPGWLR